MDSSSHPPASGSRLRSPVPPGNRAGSARLRYLARRERRRESQTIYPVPALQSHIKLFVRLSSHLVRKTLQYISGKPALLGILAIGLVSFFFMAAQHASGKVLSGVSIAGVDMTGLTEIEAVDQLTISWTRTNVTLRDGNRSWALPASELVVHQS